MEDQVKAAYAQTTASRARRTHRDFHMPRIVRDMQPVSLRDQRPRYRCHGLHTLTVGEQAGSRRRTPVTSGRAAAMLNSVPPLNSTVHTQKAPISAFCPEFPASFALSVGAYCTPARKML